MVPITLLIWLLLELSGYAALAHYWLQTPWPIAGFAAIGAMLGLRAGIVAITWAFAFSYPSPAPRLSPGQTLGMIVGEYLAFILTFVLVIPFERLWMPADRLRPCRTPILLVHGYGCSRGVWWKLRRDLEAAGHTVASISLIPPYTSVGKLVPQLKARIDQVCTACEAQQVILVAHSMGGLVCRSYLARHGIAQVKPPDHHRLAASGQRTGAYRTSARMPAKWNPVHFGCATWPPNRLNIPFASIRTPHDNYVMPQDNQRLPGG
jgi:triacylglycerol lipase